MPVRHDCLPKALQSHLPFISLALTNNFSVVQPATHRLASAQGVVQRALLLRAIRGHIRVGKCLLMCSSPWNAMSPLGDEVALVPPGLEQHPAELAVAQRFAGPRWHFCMHSLETLQNGSSTHWKGWLSPRQIFSTILTAVCKKHSFSPPCISENMQP